MFDPRADKVCAMVKDLAKYHQGEIYSMTLDWTIMEVKHPRYKGKVQQPVPLLDIQFK